MMLRNLLSGVLRSTQSFAQHAAGHSVLWGHTPPTAKKLTLSTRSIASLTLSERERIARFANRAFQDRREIIGDDRFSDDLSDEEVGEYASIVVCRYNHETAGQLFVSQVRNGEVWIKAIAVEPSLRRNGIARILVREACNVAKRAGAHTILGDSLLEYELDELYASLGFLQIHQEERTDGAIDGIPGRHIYCVYRGRTESVRAAVDSGYFSSSRRFSFAAALAVLALSTIYIPGALSWWGESFTASNMEVRAAIAASAQAQAAAQRTTLAARHRREDADEWTPAPQSVRKSFSDSLLNQFFWPIFVGGLGSVAFFLRPTSRQLTRAQGKQAIVLGSILYAICEVPSYVRNFLLPARVRPMYSYAHFDIDWKSWLYQEAEIWAFMALLALIWIQWIDEEWRVLALVRRLEARFEHKQAAEFDLSVEVTWLMTRWQAASGVMVVVYVAMFLFFWQSVGLQSDARYVSSALLLQFLGVCTLALMAAPFARGMAALRRLNLRRLRIVAASGGDIESAMKVSEALRPASPWSVTASAVLVIVTTIAPLAQFFFR